MNIWNEWPWVLRTILSSICWVWHRKESGGQQKFFWGKFNTDDNAQHPSLSLTTTETLEDVMLHGNHWAHSWKTKPKAQRMVKGMRVTMVRFHPWFSPQIRVVSRVPDQELMCALKEKTQDPMRNTMWNGNESFHDVFYHDVVQSYRHVVTRVSHHDATCGPYKQSCQRRCRSCWKTWSYFYGSAILITFKFVCKSIYSFGETSE